MQYRQGVLENARTKEANDQAQQQITNMFDLAKLELDAKYKNTLIDKAVAEIGKINWELKTEKDAYAVANQALENGVPFENLADGLKFKLFKGQGAQVNALKKYYIDKQQFELDKKKFDLEVIDTLSDNDRDAQRVKILQEQEKRLNKQQTGKDETNAERLRRIKEGLAAGGRALETEADGYNLEAAQLDAQFYNNNADGGDTTVIISQPGEKSSFLGIEWGGEEALKRAKLPVINNKQVTLDDMRTTAEAAGVNVADLYFAMLRSAEDQIPLQEAIQLIKTGQ